MYVVNHQTQLSSPEHEVYHIISDEENYCKAHREIEKMMNDGSWRYGIWTVRSKDAVDALHPYHKFDYNEDLDVYVYELFYPEKCR